MWTKEQEKATLEARGTFFVLFAKELQEWAIDNDEEQKKIDSIVRACTKYCNYLQDRLDELNKD